MTGAAWIAVDWGTTRLRAWAISAAGSVTGTAESEDGMARLAPAAFEPALLSLAGGWIAGDRTTPVIVCGMAGARNGWSEAAYRPTPCPPLPDALPERIAGTDPRIAVHILPGLAQPRPADVMRGEETQIAGLLALRPGFDGVVCLPGTHSKWARLSAGEIVSFQTFMTGEMFALLAGQSVLRHTVGQEGWDETAFAGAVDEGLSHPARIAARLFGLRAEALIADLAPATARARLSGYLIGMELAAARPYWLGQEVAVIGSEDTGAAYAAALSRQGVETARHAAGTMTLAGLATAARMAGVTA